MSDTKTKDAPLFSTVSPYDELRALLRTVVDEPEKLAALSDEQLSEQADRMATQLDFIRQAKRTIAARVNEGRLSRLEAEGMTLDQMLDYDRADGQARRLKRILGEQIASTATPAEIDDAHLSSGQVVAILGDMLALIAKQQTQIDELVYERDAFLAGFADRILDKLKAFSDGGRNYKGFEVTLDLEDEAAEKREQSNAANSDTSTSSANARDIHAEMRVLASQIGSLGAGRKVNVEQMNRTVASLTAVAKSDVRARRKGKLTVKMGEISGKKDE